MTCFSEFWHHAFDVEAGNFYLSGLCGELVIRTEASSLLFSISMSNLNTHPRLNVSATLLLVNGFYTGKKTNATNRG